MMIRNRKKIEACQQIKLLGATECNNCKEHDECWELEEPTMSVVVMDEDGVSRKQMGPGELHEFLRGVLGD